MKQSISLTARLSFLFAASSACVLLVAGLLFEHAGANQFLQRDTVELYGKMALIQKELQQTTTPQAVATLPIRLHDIVLGHPGIAVAVFSDQGNVLFSTGPQNVVQYLLRALEINSAHPTVWHSSDHVYRIMADRLQMGASSELSTNVEIGLDITNNQNFLSDFQDFLWFGMSLAMLAMGWLGWLVVHKGLAPLYAVSKAMESLSVQSLNTTIPTTNVPHELHILINSFNLMLIKLNESFNRLSEFSSDIAHELRTPIQNLMMQTQVILSHPRDIDDYRNALMSNMEEFERLSRMISDMLFLAKADNKQVVPKKEPIQLHDEVTHLFSFYEALASERQVQLRQSGCATVFADRLMLQRAFSNL